MARRTYTNALAIGTQNENIIKTKENDEKQVVTLNGDKKIHVTSNLHPLYLSNNDHPGLVLISKKLIGTDKFGLWSMTTVLSAKNKLGLVNGTLPKPNDDSPLKNQWERVNDMLISWILNTISDDIKNGMDFVQSAQEVLKELHEQFSGINGHRVYQILKDLHALEQYD
ncbi:uncharacterized protein LOC141701081 [Apium graveolens]|uniref:uncharacterized protein LOC141701081 n=1 Tax=Apium graveolens TaxID=4045 RepID=UPI003D7B600D